MSEIDPLPPTMTFFLVSTPSPQNLMLNDPPSDPPTLVILNRTALLGVFSALFYFEYIVPAINCRFQFCPILCNRSEVDITYGEHPFSLVPTLSMLSYPHSC